MIMANSGNLDRGMTLKILHDPKYPKPREICHESISRSCRILSISPKSSALIPKPYVSACYLGSPRYACIYETEMV